MATDAQLRSRGWDQRGIDLLRAEQKDRAEAAAARARNQLASDERETSGQAWAERFAAQAGTRHGMEVHYSDRPGRRSRNERL